MLGYEGYLIDCNKNFLIYYTEIGRSKQEKQMQKVNTVTFIASGESNRLLFLGDMEFFFFNMY